MLKPIALLAFIVAPMSTHSLAAAPAAPASPTLGGTSIPGLCMMSRPAVFANAKVGVAATARLRELAQQADAELAPDRTALETERQALAVGAQLSQADRQAKQRTLEQHASSLQQKTQLLSREIEATREKAMGQIATYLQPTVAGVYQAKGCGLLIDRNSVLGGNMANDLTPSVIQALDAKVTTISFNRETLPTKL